MRIGITTLGPSLDDKIAPTFECGVYLLIVETDTMQIEPEPYPGANTSRGAKPHTPQHMSDLGVKILVTGRLDPAYSRLYAAEGISFVTNMSGTAREFMEKYKSGEITPTLMPASQPVISGLTPEGMPGGPLSGPMGAGGMGGPGMPGGMGGAGPLVGAGGMGGAGMPGAMNAPGGMGGPGPLTGAGGMGMPGGMGGGFGAGPFGGAAGMQPGMMGSGLMGSLFGGAPMPNAMPGGAGQVGPGPLTGLVGGNQPDQRPYENRPPAAAAMPNQPAGEGMPATGPFGMGAPSGGPGLFYEMQERLRQLETTVLELNKRIEALEKK